MSAKPRSLPQWQLPSFAEESRRHNLPGIPSIWRCAHIDHGKVRQFRHLASVVEIVILAIGETTVDHHVTFRIQRIGINHCRYVMGRVECLLADVYAVRTPL